MSAAAEESAVQEGGASRGLAATVARGSSWQIAAQVAPLVVNIVLTPVIIAGLGIDRYGLFLLVNVIAAVLMCLDGGFGHAALRYFPIYAGTDDRRATTRLLTSMLSCTTVITLVVFGTLWVITPQAMRLFTIPEDLQAEGVFLMRALLVIVVLGLMRAQFYAILVAYQRFALPNLTILSGHVVYVVGTLLTIAQEWGLYGIAWTMLAQQIAPTFLLVPAACRYMTIGAVGFMPWTEFKEFGRYAIQMQWTNLMLLGTQHADGLLVGAFLPVRQVAYYGAGANFALQVRNVPFNALVPIQSLLGRALGVRGPEGALPDFERLQRLWVITTTGYGAVAMAAAWFGITAWLGDEFAISGTVAVLMLAAYLASLLPGVLGLWTQVLGRPELNARAVSLAAVLNIGLTLALIGPFGIIGTVLATAASQVGFMVLLSRLARSRLAVPVRSFLQDVPLLPALVAAGFVVALEWIVRPYLPQGALGLVLVGITAAPGLALYAVMTFGPRKAWSFVAKVLAGARGRAAARTAAEGAGS